jgi:hypothetical protein
MSDCRTVKEAAAFFSDLVAKGHGEAEIMFDTEARTFNYHMAKVGRAYHQGPEFTGKEFVSLHEWHERYEGSVSGV